MPGRNLVFLVAVVMSLSGCSSESHATDSPVLAFGGDVNLGRQLNAIVELAGPAAALEPVEELVAADLAIVNLESVVATIGQQADKGEKGPYYFRGRPEMLAVLYEAGIDVVGLGNNHSFDYGPDALRQMRGLLEGMSIGYAGAGASAAEACAPVFRRARNLTVALFSLESTQVETAAGRETPGTCYLDPERPDLWLKLLEPRIRDARTSAHVVIVAVHWGKNFATEPSDRTQALARAIIDAGADAILGSSGHITQGIGTYRNRPIVYDAGNLLFDLKPEPETSRSALFLLHLSNAGVTRVEVVPLKVGYGQTRTDSGQTGAEMVTRVAALSAKLGTELSVSGRRGFVEFADLPARDNPTKPVEADATITLAPRPGSQPPADCVVDGIPVAARMRPRKLGPLQLVGARVNPPVRKGRGVFWIETFWTIDESINENFFIDPRLRHRDGKPAWSGRHQPCDWLWPTLRWRPGVIYRDFYALKPARKVEPGVYDLTLRLRSGLADGNQVIDDTRVTSVRIE